MVLAAALRKRDGMCLNASRLPPVGLFGPLHTELGARRWLPLAGACGVYPRVEELIVGGRARLDGAPGNSRTNCGTK